MCIYIFITPHLHLSAYTSEYSYKLIHTPIGYHIEVVKDRP